MEQPNVTHDGAAALTPRFWVALVVASVLTGLIGQALMWLLRAVEYWAYGFRSGSYQAAVAATSPLHRVLMLLLAGVLGALGWYATRRYLAHQSSEIDDAVWNGSGKVHVRRSLATSVVSEVTIGLGASAGREAAPKLMGGAVASFLSTRFALSDGQRVLLVACAGGAGLAAVYNVPLGGAFFTAEVMLGSFALPVVLAALSSSFIATLTGWLTLSHAATYSDVANFQYSTSLLVWSSIAGVVIGLFAAANIRILGWVAHRRPRGANLLWVMPLAFTFLGIVGIWRPELFGNGIDIAHQAFLGVGTLSLLLLLAVLKPLATALTLGAGAAGGVFTPVLATGAALGGALGVAWAHLWPGAPVGACALVGAAAMIGSSMQAPLAALALVTELTHSGLGVMIPMIAATTIATLVVRTLDGYSIYTARLPRHEGGT
ncbi:MAG: chloride channel protein [Acidimicrobiaceae bacterium]|nr:chloride channel protein [Acidimicrobiaceae bacterium]